VINSHVSLFVLKEVKLEAAINGQAWSGRRFRDPAVEGVQYGG
jgi:hypothetical protein